MIRRKAKFNSNDEATLVIRDLVKKDESGSESLVFVCENPLNGYVTEQPATAIRFDDGSPEQIEEIG